MEKFGYNKFPENTPPSSFSIFFSQLKNPLVYVLLAASVVTLFLGEYPDTLIILVAVFINTVLGFVQEKRANTALSALKQMVRPTTKVLRSGHLVEIAVELLVPGDLVILDQGVRVPADGKFVEANRVFVDESMLTGESNPVAKEKMSEAFMGTIVTAGRGKMIVEKTGGKTQMGNIAIQVQEAEEDTPLKRQIAQFSRQLTVLVLGLVVFVFIVGLISGEEFEYIFTTSVALAVSAIPEGLLIGVTAVLALGMQAIARRKGLVRHLVSAETLGAVSTICVDKTGTLTQGKMKVVKATGNKKQLVMQSLLANDLDDPIVVAAWEWAKREKDFNESKYKRLDSIPFSSKTRYFASLSTFNNNKNVMFVNGAAEYLLEWSSLSSPKKQKIYEQIDELTSEGKRVLGMARKITSNSYKKINEKHLKNNLDWVGLLVFEDPVRRGVSATFSKTKQAGLRTIVITGDYMQTALAVVKELDLDIKSENVFVGDDLKNISPQALSAKMAKNPKEAFLFARTTPDQKLKIVDALKKNGEVVAMMGDGVNDAPALKKADIGIVVGSATDVAKESADLVLLDSNFSTIIAAIEEGRGIFDNIRKVMLYLISDSFEEIFAVIGAIILNLPLPVTAAQILWINLVSDGFPNLALTVDPKEPDIMRRSPRSSKEPLVPVWMRILILIVSGFGGLVALAIFYYYHYNVDNDQLARSVAFVTLGINSLVYVFSIRSLHKPFWRENPFKNKWLNLAVAVGVVFQFIPFLNSATRRFFDLATLSIQDVGVVFAASFVMFIMIETSKDLLEIRK